MRAFLTIKEARLREAIIILVEELARSDKRLAQNSKTL
jgi:hypothetical protein